MNLGDLATSVAAAYANFGNTPECPAGQYKMPSGACTPINPLSWAWQCGPGIGSDASCVGIPEPEALYPPASGIMPAVQAAPPAIIVDALFLENTDRYALWSSCHPVGSPLDEWAGCPGGAAVVPAGVTTGLTPQDAGAGTSSIFGAFGCLLVGLAILGAVGDVVGKR